MAGSAPHPVLTRGRGARRSQADAGADEPSEPVAGAAASVEPEPPVDCDVESVEATAEESSLDAPASPEAVVGTAPVDVSVDAAPGSEAGAWLGSDDVVDGSVPTVVAAV